MNATEKNILTDDNGNPSSGRVIAIIFAINSILLSWVCCGFILLGTMYNFDINSLSIIFELTIWFAGVAILGKGAQKLIELKWGK